MKELIKMLTMTPRTRDELAFRTKVRFGALVVVILIGWIAVRVALEIWPLLLCVAILWIIVRVVRRQGKHRRR